MKVYGKTQHEPEAKLQVVKKVVNCYAGACLPKMAWGFSSKNPRCKSFDEPVR